MSTDTKQRNNELFPLVAAGDIRARDEMIVLNVPLVTFKVDSYLACFEQLEYLRDDLVGEGNLALVEAVDRIRAGSVKNTNVTGYLSIAIQKQIGHCIDAELFLSSERTTRLHRQQGQEPPSMHKVPNSEFVISKLDHDPRTESELLDLILGCCRTDEEQAIVDLRIKGYKDPEIAKVLEIPLTTVYMLRRELHERVLGRRGSP